MWQVMCEFSFCRSEGQIVLYQTFGQTVVIKKKVWFFGSSSYVASYVWIFILSQWRTNRTLSDFWPNCCDKEKSLIFRKFVYVASYVWIFILSQWRTNRTLSDFWPNLNFPLERQIKFVLKFTSQVEAGYIGWWECCNIVVKISMG